MLARSWKRFNSIIAIPVPLPSLNPWRMSSICRLAQRRVLISTSTILHRVSSRPIPLVLVVPFGIRTRIIHPNSWVISPMLHMFCTRSTRHAQRSLRRGLRLFLCRPPYATSWPEDGALSDLVPSLQVPKPMALVEVAAQVYETVLHKEVCHSLAPRDPRGPCSGPQWWWGPWNISGPPSGSSDARALTGVVTCQRVGSGWFWWRAHILTRSACGSAWNISPTWQSSPSLQVWHWSELPQHWAAVPSGRSPYIWSNYDNMLSWRSSPWQVPLHRILRVIPHGWPAPSQRPGRSGCSASQW